MTEAPLPKIAVEVELDGENIQFLVDEYIKLFLEKEKRAYEIAKLIYRPPLI